MRLTSILLVGLYASFTPLADLFLVHATLEISPPEFAFLRLYNEPNCEVKYHQTGYKDFQRVECRPEPNLTQCATGKFLSYRLEENPATPGMPKIDQLIVKKNTSVCEIEPDFNDAMVFQPHPDDNSHILTPGCHLFNPTSPLDIDTNLHLPNSFWCTYTPMTQESPFDAQQFSEDGAQMPMRGAPPLGEGLEDEYGDSMMDPEATPGGGPPGPNALLGGGPPGQYDDELDGPLPPSGPPGPPGPPLGPPPAGIPLSGLNGLPKGPPHGPPFGGPPGPPFGPPPPGFPPSLAPPRGPPMPPPPRHQGGHPPFPPPPYPFPPPQ